MKRRQGSLGRESVDTAPTAADFPRRMWDKKDIGPDYRKYLNMWLRAGVDLGCVILVPAARYQPDIREYMLSYFGDEIMVLERGEDGAVTKTVIKRKDIFCFCSTEDLLRGCISIYWGTRYEIHRTALPYNRVRRKLFLPVSTGWRTARRIFTAPKHRAQMRCRGGLRRNSPPSIIMGRMFTGSETVDADGNGGDWAPPGLSGKRGR